MESLSRQAGHVLSLASRREEDHACEHFHFKCKWRLCLGNKVTKTGQGDEVHDLISLFICFSEAKSLDFAPDLISQKTNIV